MFNRVLSRVCLGAGPFGDKVAVSAKGFWAYLPIHASILVSVSLLSACNSDSQEVVLNPVDTAKMQQTVEQLAKEMLVPGAVVILRTPRGDFKTAYGVTRYGGSEATDFDQHVRVGSNTKTWVGTVILQMAQQGRLQLSDTVSMYLDNVPNGESITIEHLLTMRSGLFNYSTTLELNQTLDEQPTKVWTQTELLAMSFAHKPGFAPGSAFEYSNTNTVLLGLIAEQIDGKPLAAVMQQRLFAPWVLSGLCFPISILILFPRPWRGVICMAPMC
ncbi:serine hydrolase domain-containing protein [Shewanella sp. JL219SE-S6]